MREILFRAKAINRDPYKSYRTNYKNGDWVNGLITQQYDERFKKLPAEMTNTDGVSGIDVDYKTIGQYTGLTDKNDTKIFEGDIVRYNDTIHEVIFCTINGSAFFGITMPDRGEIWNFDGITCANKMEVIGNIYDDPELLGDAKMNKDGETK